MIIKSYCRPQDSDRINRIDRIKKKGRKYPENHVNPVKNLRKMVLCAKIGRSFLFVLHCRRGSVKSRVLKFHKRLWVGNPNFQTVNL